MLTSSVDGEQTPLLIDQRKMFTPVESPDTFELGRVALAKNPEPETTVHTPLPETGVLAANVVADKQIV